MANHEPIVCVFMLSSTTRLNNPQLDQAVGPSGPDVGHGVKGRGNDDHLGLGVEHRYKPRPKVLSQDGLRATGGESAADVSDGAEADAEVVDDFLVDVAGVGADEDLNPVLLSAGERPILCPDKLSPILAGRLHHM